MAYFPFMVDISGKKCLVAGGGRIAFHKVRILLDFDVQIKVVAEEVCGELAALREQTPLLEIFERGFQKTDIYGMDFVVAATDREDLNHDISVLCREAQIPVNAVDMKEDCDFIFPAIIRNGDVLAAVSTGGNSPASASYLKARIREQIPEYYGRMVDTLGTYREEIRERVPEAKGRKELFYRLLAYGDDHGGEIPEEVMRGLLEEYTDK